MNKLDTIHLKLLRESSSPDKIMARRLTNKAINEGIIQREVCEVCKSNKSQIHHLDYHDPFHVMWLCLKHHKEWHSQHDKVGWLPRRVIKFDSGVWGDLEWISRKMDVEIEDVLKTLIKIELIRTFKHGEVSRKIYEKNL